MLFLQALCLLFFTYVSNAGSLVDSASCPVGRPTVQYEKEVYIFLLQSNMSLWEKLPWNIVTTVALEMTPDPTLVCLAHKNNVRVVKTSNFPVQNLTDTAERTKWVLQNIEYVQKYNLDGINIDFESPIAKNLTATRKGLTALVKEATDTFHSKINGSQVSFDVAWSPDGIDGRFYDHVAIADAADFVFIMSYDEQSQIRSGPCTARANSGYDKTFQGMFRYMDMGIPTNKLILGLPWYGYKYFCEQLLPNNTCNIKKVPFRGCPCSDAAGSEVGYDSILKIFSEHATSARMWDKTTKSPFFNFKIDGKVGQMRYDDPVSLKLKYQMAQGFNLRGVGMWTANFLDYSDTARGKKQRDAMWQAIPYRH